MSNLVSNDYYNYTVKKARYFRKNIKKTIRKVFRESPYYSDGLFTLFISDSVHRLPLFPQLRRLP